MTKEESGRRTAADPSPEKNTDLTTTEERAAGRTGARAGRTAATAAAGRKVVKTVGKTVGKTAGIIVQTETRTAEERMWTPGFFPVRQSRMKTGSKAAMPSSKPIEPEGP